MPLGSLHDGGLRQAMLVLAAVAAIGMMVELALIGHWHGPAQLAPWLGAQASLTAAWLASGAPSAGAWRGRLRVRSAQLLAVGQLLACGFGVAVHLQANWGFAAELHRSAGLATVAAAALQGRIPLLAPAFGAMPALLVLLASAAGSSHAVATAAVAPSSVRPGRPPAAATPPSGPHHGPDGRRQVWPPIERRDTAAVRSGLWRVPRDLRADEEDPPQPN